ncbi:hypothetical protein RHGRI_008834 [Rhododendron griersonianum]|uniref:t-SNARE coiled-coil homology domain-containing protein n=1 Tax=Rhododendron griersonianum TaxID=479676 RepID=A0AAV6L4B8_9ERIC|nr:hypothetical protein RHGRI_008834 [Rhododendron griersonianum]
MSFEDLESGRPLTFNGRQHRQDPSQAVAAGVFQINTAVNSYQRLVNSLGTPKDTFELRQKMHKSRQHIGQLVKETSAKLKQASETDQHTDVSASKKIADAKLAKDFQSVLREFQKAQRLAAERETAYAPFVPKEVVSSSPINCFIGESDLPKLYSPICVSVNMLCSSDITELEMDSTKSQQFVLLMESRRQEVVMMENEVVFNDAIIEEREQGILEIQQQIGEVNDIFKDLAVLVREQGVMIDLSPVTDLWYHSDYRGHSCGSMTSNIGPSICLGRLPPKCNLTRVGHI